MKKQSEMNGTNFLNAQKNSQFKDMVRRLFKNKAAVKRGEIRKQAKSLKSSRLWTAGKQVTTE